MESSLNPSDEFETSSMEIHPEYGPRIIEDHPTQSNYGANIPDRNWKDLVNQLAPPQDSTQRVKDWMSRNIMGMGISHPSPRCTDPGDKNRDGKDEEDVEVIIVLSDESKDSESQSCGETMQGLRADDSIAELSKGSVKSTAGSGMKRGLIWMDNTEIPAESTSGRSLTEPQDLDDDEMPVLEAYRCENTPERSKIGSSGENPCSCNICGMTVEGGLISLAEHRKNCLADYYIGARTNSERTSAPSSSPDLKFSEENAGDYTEEATSGSSKVGEEVKPFKCSKCSSRFIYKWRLESHELRHTGEKPFKCDYCPYRAMRKDRVRDHQRIHTGEKPYGCKYCDFKTSHRNYVRIHERRHTSVRENSN